MSDIVEDAARELEFPQKFMDADDIASRSAQLEVFHDEVWVPVYAKCGLDITFAEAYQITLLQNIVGRLDAAEEAVRPWWRRTRRGD